MLLIFYLAFPAATKASFFVRGSGMGGGIGSILYSDRSVAGGSNEFFTYNAVGHTVALTLDDGTMQKADLYEAYGNIVSSTGSSLNNRLANTKERDYSLVYQGHIYTKYNSLDGRGVCEVKGGHDTTLAHQSGRRVVSRDRPW